MRAVVQKVTQSSVTVEGQVTGAIEQGFCVLLGVSVDDKEEDALYIAKKVSGLRIFEDENDKLNLSIKDVGGSVLAISQFTLYGDARHGNRPGFTEAARPEEANKLYRLFCDTLKADGIHVEEGVFRTHMHVSILNDGPTTILLDSKKVF